MSTIPSLFTGQTTSRIVANWEMRSSTFHFRRGSPLACGVMGIACSSFICNVLICRYKHGVLNKCYREDDLEPLHIQEGTQFKTISHCPTRLCVLAETPIALSSALYNCHFDHLHYLHNLNDYQRTLYHIIFDVNYGLGNNFSFDEFIQPGSINMQGVHSLGTTRIIRHHKN